MAVSINYTEVAPRVAIPGYPSPFIFHPVTADLNLDGFQDLLVLGAYYPAASAPPVSQPGALLLGNGTGAFTAAPAGLFPATSTVHPRKVVFADFNGDHRPDVFIADHGWDTDPFPGAQNRLYLSQGSSWVDATDRLPALSDFTHTAAAGDIDGDGDIDLFVGNGYSGQQHILSYMLVNDGSGHFTMTRDNIPAASGSVLDFDTVHHFPGATLADLDRDGLPELVITADASASYDRLRESVVLWNHAGKFSETGMTVLPANGSLPNQIVTDAQAVDVNGDGLMDIVQTGTQGQPFYDGWFLQVLLNQGNHQFVDATSTLMAAADRFGGTPGGAAGAPWALWLRPLDFNADGFMDLTVEYNSVGVTVQTPLVWLNDGTGHYSTLKAGDFVDAGKLWEIGGAHFYPSANGYSVATTQVFNGSGGLVVTGLLAKTPFTDTPDSGLAHSGTAGNDRLRGGSGDDVLQGFGGIDTAVYFGPRSAFQVARSGTALTVQGSGTTGGHDTLQGVERLEFRDGNVAFDLDANAGKVAKVLGAVFGAGMVSNPVYAGIGLDLLDHGTTDAAAMDLALNVRLGAGASNAQVVNLLYTNIVGQAPSPADQAYFTGWLDQGVYTRAELGWFAAGLDLNLANIGFTGLVHNGLAYEPA